MAAPAPLRHLLCDHPIVPVVTLDDAQDALPLAEALIAGGIGVVEITLRSVAGMAAIRHVKRARPDIVVAAGTVLSPEQMAQARAAGADFCVSPGATPALIEAAVVSQTPYLPGVATASEAMRAAEAGLDLLKFFPAEASGGIAALRSLADPLPHLAFCPSGGIGAANMATYLVLPNVFSVSGSWIADRQAIRDGDWDGIAARAGEAIAAARRAITPM